MNKPLESLKWGLVCTLLFYLSNLQAQVDLFIINPTITSSSIPAGKLETVGCQVQNVGSNPSSTFVWVDYYLSRDMVFDVSDISLGNRSASVASNWTVNVSNYITIPLSADTGSYYLLLIADKNNMVTETDETNNVTVLPITVTPATPDFRIINSSVNPRVVIPNTTTDVRYTVVNDGVGSDSIDVGFYLSTDNQLSANDVFIGSSRVDSLAQNGSLQDTATVTIPTGSFPYRYYLLIYADYLNTQPELSETNNLGASLLFVQLVLPDLSIRNASLSFDTIEAGYSTAVYNFMDNNGGDANSTTRTAYYLSTDTLFDASDVFLRDEFVQTMFENNPATTNNNVSIPVGTPPGDYYIVSYLDHEDDVFESNENNNTFFSPVTILPAVPDLMLSTLTVNVTTAMPNTSIGINSTLRNRGAIASPMAEVKYYLSTNSSYDSTALLIDSIVIPSLNPLQNHSYNFNYTLPANLALGAYHVIAMIDPSDLIAEYYETNNTGTRYLTVVGVGPPDLTIGAIQSNATTAVPSGYVEFTVAVENIGQNMGGGNLGYYWSTDTLYDNTDLYIEQNFMSGLVPNSTQTVTEDILIPLVSVYGTYYILFFADHQAVLTEADETNNVAYFPVVVDTLYKPDLVPVAYQTSQDTARVGTTVNCSATIQNRSTSAVSLSYFRYFLSTDTIFDNTDIHLTSSNIASMGAYQTQSDNYNVTIPYTAAAGEYYVLFYADPYNSISEANEDNNVAYQTTKFVVLGNSNLQPDLVIPNYSISKDSVEVSDLVTVTIDLHNNASRAATSHRLSYYWSLDTLWDNTDVYLDSRTVSGLTSGNSRTEMQNLNIPTGLALGNYHILVVADDLQQVAESDERNNVAVVPVVVRAPLPELSISSLSASSSSLQAGMATTVYYNVRNTGVNTAVGGHYTGYYLSSDNVFDVSDTYLGEGYIDTVTINGTTRDTALILIPSSTPAGNYYLICYADHRQQQAEQDETNNTRSRSITVRVASSSPYPDLVVRSASVGNNTIAPSFTTTVSCTVRNIGSGSSYNYARVGYYLSATPYYNSSMIELWYSSVGILNTGASITVGSNVMIPAGTPAGNYYILFFADDHRVESESDEQNNIDFVSITVTGTANTQTDLIVDDPSISAGNTIAGLPATPAGNTIDLTSTIKNLGNSTGTSFVGYYLSTDQIYSTSDVYLGNEFVGSLLANGSSVETSTVTIPVATSAGTYYILFRADYQGQISERLENNNVVAVPFSVMAPVADLVAQNTFVSTSVAAAGDFIGVRCNVANIGAGFASGTNIGYYLSTVPTYTNAAIFLGAEYIPSLWPSAVVQKSTVLPIGLATPSGTYYLLFYADHEGLELESNDGNNIATQTITIIGNPLYQPDVIVEHPSIATSSLIGGNSTTVDCSIRNQGGINAHAALTGYYLSADTLFDPTDVLVGTSNMTPINSNDTLLQTTTITIANNTALGNYYVLYIADHLNTLSESNNNNNLAYVPLTIIDSQVDLVVKQAMATPTALFSGMTVIATSWVHNQGIRAVSNTDLGYYLSTDTLHDNGDVYLGASPVGTLQGGDSSVQQLVVTIPIATTTGNYYLLYYADHQVTRAETDKTNNMAYVALAITEPEPDLRIRQANLASNTITVGRTVFTGGSLENIGSAVSGSCTIGYYLSTDSVYSANDILLTTDNNSGLGAGNSLALYSNITLANGTAPGNYYILFYADNQNNVIEGNENNNIQAVAITVVLPLPDLSMTNISVSSSTLNPGDVFNVSCYVNNNSLQGAGSHRLGYYITTSPLFTNAIPLGDAVITGVVANGSVPKSMSLTLPAGTSPGNYYIAFYVDDQFAVAEANESNNRMYFPINVPDLPDARVRNATVNPTSAVAGSTVSLSCIVENIGGTILYYSTLGYYLSPTPTYNSSTAVLLRSTSLSNIVAGSSTVRTTSGVIPANTVPGNYYILYYADATNIRAERDETNNIQTLAITIREPLSDLQVYSSAAAYISGQIQVSSYLANTGTGISGSINLGYFLSTDPFYDNGDVLLGTDFATMIPPSAGSYESSTLSVPGGTNSGVYYVLFVADYLETEPEEDETNNTASEEVLLTININKLPTAELLIYPNPTLERVVIELGRTYEEVQVQVYNPLGQLIQTTEPQTTANLSLDLEGPTGVYLLQITTKEGSFGGIPIVKE